MTELLLAVIVSVLLFGRRFTMLWSLALIGIVIALLMHPHLPVHR
jgi:Sec-independent protein translocase protein TatA